MMNAFMGKKIKKQKDFVVPIPRILVLLHDIKYVFI